MYAKWEKLVRYILALMLMGGALATHAATQSIRFSNTNEVNYGFFFSDDVAELQFTSLRFGGQMNTWNNDVLTPAEIVYSGPTVLPGRRRLQLTFDYQLPQVSFQWATVLFDGVNHAIQGSSTFTFDSTQRPRNAWSSTAAFSAANTLLIDNYFNNPGAAAVPLPNSVVLMLSAMAFAGFTRRGNGPVPESIQTREHHENV